MDQIVGIQPAPALDTDREQFLVFYKDATKQHRKGYLFSDFVAPVEVVRDLLNPGEEFEDDRS